MSNESLNCRCCGGVLNVQSNLCVCKYCGTTNFISNVASKYITQLNRANKLRQECEFDNAAGIYDAILEENEPTADILWFRSLCEYGIEYVPDPVSEKYFPTLHRIKDESILDCSFCKHAIDLSEGEQKETISKEAEYIYEVQTKYLNIAANEDPYDVFICYKETDLGTGKKTEDVLLAEELYNELTGMGYKVFFARETLKEKLSIEYEPYIFAALKSAKAMAVIGTKAEYFASVWVKNEWGRFLKLMEKNPEKQMFFACDDPEELPRAFAGKQAQLLGNENAIKNLAANIDKFLNGSQKDNNSYTVLSKEQQQFDKILADRSNKFLDDLAETDFGKNKKRIINNIEIANVDEEKKYTFYKKTFDIGSIWILVFNAISLLAFYWSTVYYKINLGEEQYNAEYYSISRIFIVFFITIGILLLLSCNFYYVIYGSAFLVIVYLFMSFGVKIFNILNPIIMFAIPLLILYIGFIKKGNRYYKKNKAAVETAYLNIQGLSRLEEFAHKEFRVFAKNELEEYKRNCKNSNDVQIKEHHYDKVKSSIIEDLNGNAKKYGSRTDENDSDFYNNSKHRIICTIIYFAIAAIISIGHIFVIASPEITIELARLLFANG